MDTLNDLIQKKKDYIKHQAQVIVDRMIERGVFTDTMETCDYPNWDRELHRNMPEIVRELKTMGVDTTSSVNFGVTDWVFKIKVN